MKDFNIENQSCNLLTKNTQTFATALLHFATIHKICAIYNTQK